jgi:hypothetical protein
MTTIYSFSGELPENFYTVVPHSDPDTEIGPFATRKEADDFSARRFLTQARVREYHGMHLAKREEISAEEYANFMRNPKTRGLIDPATI